MFSGIDTKLLANWAGGDILPNGSAEIYSLYAISSLSTNTNLSFILTRINPCRKQEYAALQVGITGENDFVPWKELRRLKQLEVMGRHTDHEGARYFPKLQNHFEITGPNGQHQCLVQDLTVANVFNMPKCFGFRVLREAHSKEFIQKTLLCLNCLHTEAKMMHTGMCIEMQLQFKIDIDKFLAILQKTNTRNFVNIDARLSTVAEITCSGISPRSIFFNLLDSTVYEDWARLEQEQPSPCIADRNHILYQTRELDLSDHEGDGDVVVSDMGLSIDGSGFHNHAPPDPYRAPELMFPGLYKSSAVDIWSLGIMVCAR